MVSVPAISRSKLSADSSSTVGLICLFSASGSNTVSKIVGGPSDDVVDRETKSKIRSRDTYYSHCQYSGNPDYRA